MYTMYQGGLDTEEAWTRILGDGYGSLYLTNSAMAGFSWWIQREILEPFAERFFAEVTAVFRDRDNEFAREFGRFLFPNYLAQPWVLERSREVLAAAGDSLPTLTRTLLEANDELERMLRCRELAGGEAHPAGPAESGKRPGRS